MNGCYYVLLMQQILPEDPFSFFGNAVWKPGCPLETCTPRGLERDCGNTDADGARATRPRDGDGDGAVLWMVWWIRHKNSGINSPYGGIIWNYDPYAIMVSEYSCYQYKPRSQQALPVYDRKRWWKPFRSGDLRDALPSTLREFPQHVSQVSAQDPWSEMVSLRWSLQLCSLYTNELKGP